MADLAARIDELEAMILQAKAMPLSSSVLLNREELLDTVRDMRELLPEEIKQARWVVKDREELLAKARARSEEMIAEARSRQDALAEKSSVAEAAREKADRIVSDAEEAAHRIRREADDYVDARLERLESVLRRAEESMTEARDSLERTATQVSRGRRHLREGDGG